MEMGDNLSFEIAVDNDHPEILAEGLEYEGRRYRAEARLAGKIYGSAFGVDVAFADPCFGTPEVLVGRPFLAFAGIGPASIRAYPLGTHIAEKVHAYTLPRKRVNSRVKDLPDLALLGTVSRPMSAIGLREAIQRTFEHRGTHGVPSELPPPPDSWVSLYAKIAQSNDLQWPSLAEVFEVTRFELSLDSGSEDLVLCRQELVTQEQFLIDVTTDQGQDLDSLHFNTPK